ncbi:MAG: FkbM family methyltransferase [Pseudomonadota bacterium]
MSEQGDSGEAGDTERRFEEGRDRIAQGKRCLVEGHAMMRALSAEVRPARARGAIHQLIWDCERLSHHRSQFFSQSGQDAFLDERVFNGKRGGVFVEIGGFDGITSSNCLFFELMRGWSGLLVEPSTGPRARAAEFRRCPCLPIAVSTGSGEGAFLEIEKGPVQMSGLVETYDPGLREKIEGEPRYAGRVRPARQRSLAQVLDSHHMREVDLISLDVVGAEFAVLSSFPFEEYTVRAWAIDGSTHGPRIQQLMQARGYRRIEAMGSDDIYITD